MARHTNVGEIDRGWVEMAPNSAYALQAGTWKLTYHCGARQLTQGARVRFYPPFTFDNSHNSCVRWSPGSVSVSADCEAEITVKVLDTMQAQYAEKYSVEVIEACLVKGQMSGGDSFTVIMGDQRNSGQPAVAQWLAGPDMPFHVAVADPDSEDFVPLADYPVFPVFGGKAEMLTAVLPATAQVGDRFDLRLKAEDGVGNPSALYQNRLFVEPESGLHAASETCMAMVNGGITCLEDVELRSAGTWHVRVTDGERSTVSNPVSTEFTRPGEKIFWGEIHGHTELSDGVGGENRFYEFARDTAMLDFSAISDHAGGRGWWPACIEAARRYDNPGRFVTLLGYETAWGGGHLNVYTRDLELPVCDSKDRDAIENERRQMHEMARAGKVIMIPHHPNDSLLKEAALFRWEQNDPIAIRLVEMCQMRGAFEMDRPGPHILFQGFGCSVQDGLRQGFRFGFIGGTDNHAGRSGSPMMTCFHAAHRQGSAETCDLRQPYYDRTLGGLTAVFSSELRRENIYDALYARRCYATTGARILLNFEVNGLGMGSEGTCRAPAQIRGRVAGTAPLKSIAIVRNNEDVYTVEGRDWDHILEWEDADARPGCWYYLRVIQQDGHVAWSSPVWLD